jgi:NAD(P)-dependent dehydrogenase (short-subunit alcohol dehydrogenase family)
MSMKTVLITGANRGIGLEHTRRFAANGAQVFATARSPENARELRALAAEKGMRIEILAYEASDAEACARLKAALANEPLDLVFANAGAPGDKTRSFGSIHVEDTLKLLHVNALAPLKLVEALADNVARSQRKLVAFQSSRMGSVAENSSGGSYPYRISKCALNMVTRNVAIDLKPRGVTVVALHPGWVRTRMGGDSAPVSVDESVTGQQQLLENLTLADTGRFLNYDGSDIPW